MDYLVELVERGDFCSLLGLVALLVYVGQFVAVRDAWAQAWGQRLAVLAFIAFCGYGVMTVGEPNASALLFVALRGLLAGGLALGVSWNVLGVVAFLRARSREASAAAEARASIRRSERELKKRQKEEEKQRKRNQEEWKRAAPERERRQREEEARQREREQRQSEARHRRQEVLVASEALFMLYAPEIRDRFGRKEFDDFVAKFMTDAEPPETIETRGKQLQQLIRDHHDRVNPPERFHSLEDLASWYAVQKREIESLPVDDSFKDDYLVQLNERYAELTQQVMEKLAP